MRIYTANQQTGHLIEEVASIEAGIKLIKAYEEEDRKDGNFTQDFYSLMNEEHETIYSELYNIDIRKNDI